MRGHDAVDTMQEHHTRDSTQDETRRPKCTGPQHKGHGATREHNAWTHSTDAKSPAETWHAVQEM